MRSILRNLLYPAGIALVAAAVVVHLDPSWPLSSVNGTWQIQDWYEHPDASQEQLAAYTAARQHYPKTIAVRPFWKATVGSNSECRWSQHIEKWSLPPGKTGVWTTTVVCEGERPIMMYVAPTSMITSARLPGGLYEFYAEMGSVPIEVVFSTERGFTYIDYIPASWPGRPRIQQAVAADGDTPSRARRAAPQRAAAELRR